MLKSVTTPLEQLENAAEFRSRHIGPTEADPLLALSAGELLDAALLSIGAAAGTERGLYALSCSATPRDMR